MKGGGLNGRPEKLPDVCYSWYLALLPPLMQRWVVSVLAIIGRLDWISKPKLISFILAAQVRPSVIDSPCRCVVCFLRFRAILNPGSGNQQDEEKGGIADRPGDVADIFHTFFGLAGTAY